MTQDLAQTENNDDREGGLSWPRIAGISFALALHAATEAALLIRDRSAATVSATKSSRTDVVTEMDRRSQELIADLVRRARPQDGFYGEEQGEGEGTSGITWVVDPIDGTVNYVYDIPAFAVSIAAVEGDVRHDVRREPLAHHRRRVRVHRHVEVEAVRAPALRPTAVAHRRVQDHRERHQRLHVHQVAHRTLPGRRGAVGITRRATRTSA